MRDPEGSSILLLNVLVVASEALPLAKTGGLGDAVSGMARAMREAGVEVTLLLPAYRGVMRQLVDVKTVGEIDDLPGGPASLVTGRIAQFDLPVILLRNDALYDRDGTPYLTPEGREHADNGVRFAALAHAATRIAAGRTPLAVPHVVHANDWHAGLVPLLMHAAGIRRVKSVITIHNLAFQGVFPMADAEVLGIPRAYCTPDGCEYWGNISFMKAGLRFADRITAVSRTYAREILTPAFGMGLEGLLYERRGDLVAIPNGFDADIWNPALDAFLPDTYSATDLQGKATCKRELQETFGLIADPQATLIVSGSRLTTQKMGDVALEALPAVLDAHPAVQVAVLGCGDHAIEEGMRGLMARYPGRVSVQIGYDERRAHLLHAGGDILLHGSRFEPFGLTPIYAMRYGTLPICSRVGGLADSIKDPGKTASQAAMATATGVLFDGETALDMIQAIERALHLRAQPALWHTMQKNAMTANHSWEVPAGHYTELFRELSPRTVSVPRANTSPVQLPVRARLPVPALETSDVLPALAARRRAPVGAGLASSLGLGSAASATA